jgi:hypothetical protein
MMRTLLLARDIVLLHLALGAGIVVVVYCVT